MSTLTEFNQEIELIKILNSFKTYQKFFTATQSNQEESFECDLILKNINLHSKDLAWHPKDSSQKLQILMDMPFLFKCDSGRISFETEYVHLHGKKLLITHIPDKVNVENLRSTTREDYESHYHQMKMKVTSKSSSKLMDGPEDILLLDFSNKGMAVKANCGIDELNFNLNGPIELSFKLFSQQIQNFKGYIKNRNFVKSVSSSDPSFWRLGIELDKTLNTSSVKKVLEGEYLEP